jgi:UDP-glucose 4-epimerase
MTWLVTGGAGYIGAHTVHGMRAAGHRVVVVDDLSAGDRSRVPSDVPLVVTGIDDRATLARTLTEHEVTGVLHLAARKSAPESVARPTYYYRENIGGLATLLDAMLDTGVGQIVFSSSAAVYGIPPDAVVTERTPAVPINPYGQTKLVGEQLIEAAGRAHGISWIALRYFNAAGAADPALCDHGRDNLFPRIFHAMSSGQPLTVNGADRSTPDSTGVRDYVHVADLADAQIAAIDRLAAGPAATFYNVGTGRGHSVLQVIERMQAVSGQQVPYVMGPSRPGDPAQVVASPEKITRELGWTPRRDLTDMVTSAWQAWQSSPGGQPPAASLQGRLRMAVPASTPASPLAGPTQRTP